MRTATAFLLALLALAACTGTSGAATSPPRPARCAGACWKPTTADTFYWQLQGVLLETDAASVYDVDLFDTSTATVRRLEAAGHRTVCYVSAGSFENWRSDASRFPATTLGRPLDGWPGERWLDIRRMRQLRPIMSRRIALCARRGFDGIEFDNVAAFEQRTGFSLTGAQQLRYNRWLADEAHRRGLAVALKNDPTQARILEPWFDFAVTEECFQYSECGRYLPFLRAGKPVFDAEYSLPTSDFCARAGRLGIMASRYGLELDGGREPCP